MIRYSSYLRMMLSATTVGLAVVGATGGATAQTQGTFGVRASVQAADPSERGDGTMGAAATAAFRYGPLPAGPADLAAKAAANLAYQRAEAAGAFSSTGRGLSGLTDDDGRLAPSFVPGRAFQGLFSIETAPPDTTGAIGPTRYIELVNSLIGIYSRTSTVPVGTGTLDTLFAAPGANNFDPQIIWDFSTTRFYYAGDSVFSDTDNRIAWGFSKTASPSNASTDWCHYFVNYGAVFPDYPKLGDSAGLSSSAPTISTWQASPSHPI